MEVIYRVYGLLANDAVQQLIALAVTVGSL